MATPPMKELPVSVIAPALRIEEEEPSVSPYLPSDVKKHLFLRAILAGRCERVKELLQAGVDPNTTFLTRILLKEPLIPETLTAAFTPKDEDSSFVTALTLAMTLLFQEIRLCLPTLMSNMIEAYEPRPNEPAISELDTDDWPRVRCVQSLAPQWAVFVLLLRAGADPNLLSFDQKPPLVWALASPACLYPVLRHLFHAGADLRITGPYHPSFLFERLLTQARWVDPAVLRLAICHGATLTADHVPPYHRVITARGLWFAGVIPTLELFLEAGYDVDQLWKDESALIVAIRKRHIEMVVWLLCQGACCYHGGKPALEQATKSFPELVPVLMKMSGGTSPHVASSSVAQRLLLVKIP